jgi:type I restriction enzyme, S subunit
MGEYPPDWDVAELGAIGTWKSGGTPSTSNPAYWDGDIPWISPASLKSFDIRDSDRRVTELGANNGTRRALRGTVIFVVRGMSLKSEFRIGVTSRDVTFGQDCKAIEPPVGVNARYLAYSLKAKDGEILAMVDEAGHGTGRLPTRQLVQLRVGIPDEREQERILDVFGSVDDSIRSTERIIAKLRESRIGLIRASTAGGPGWITSRLSDVVPRVEYGVSVPLRYGSGTPVLRMNNLSDGEVSMGDIKSTDFDVPFELMLRPGDILFNRTNSLDHVGRTAIWRGRSGTHTFASYLVRLNCDPSRLLPEYLNLWMGRPEVQTAIRAYATPGVQQVNINPTNLRKVWITLPLNIDDQESVVRLINAQTGRIAQEKAELEKLRRVKQGLMEDLLTGQVRVKAGVAG